MLPNKDLSEVSRAVSVDVLFGVGQLEVHVSVGGDEISLVFVTPFQLDHHGFAGQVVEERLGVHGHRHFGGCGGRGSGFKREKMRNSGHGTNVDFRAIFENAERGAADA